MRALRGVVWLLVGLAVAVLESGLSCGPSLINSVTPADGAVIATPSFTIQIQLGAGADPSTLSVDLNGVDITGQLAGGPPNYTKTMNPGAPLRDTNTLTVRVRSTGAVGALLPITFQYAVPKAHAFVVTDPSQCPTGPLAHCTPGDFMMANDSARFVIQKAAQRDEHFTGTFGGNLIDAEVVTGGVPQGNDNFWEVQPALNIETVVNAQTAEIVNDGQDGTPAIVRTCGPDDLLDDINASSAVAQVGGTFPDGVDDQDYDIDACTNYTLTPGTRTLTLTTTVENNEADDLPLYVGDYLNGGGTTEQFTPLSLTPAGPLAQFGVGEALVNWGIQALSLFGYSDQAGVDYALLVPQPPTVTYPSSSFTQTGVSYVLHGNAIPLVLGFGAAPTFSVPAGGSNSFTRWFSVGDGSASNAIQSFLDATAQPSGTLKGCVRDSAGQPVPGARVVAARDSSGGTTSIKILRDHWVAGSDGCYQGRIGTGNYLVAAAKEGYPYEGGGSTAATHLVTVTSGGTTVQDVVLPQTGHLHVSVVDQNHQPIPARVGVVGFDPSPEPTLTGTVLKSGDTKTNVFYDYTSDSIPPGMTRTDYTDATGTLDLDVEPGTYEIAVSRGNEYSLFTQQNVAISAGSTTTVNANVALVLDTTGFISSDYHVHMAGSPDSRISHRDRIRAYAGEGVDNLITTDHAKLTDLMPEITALGFAPWLFTTQGEEITTFDYGHFNAYPQGTDPNAVQTHGATDHGGAAPPGMDFPAYGHFNLSPAEIEAAAVSKPQNAGLETVVQINHISSHFDPLKINTSLTPPASQMGPGEPSFFRLDPSIPNFFHAFAALELWNGYTKDQAYCEFLGAECASGSPDGRIGIWMNLLNQGIKTTAVADTDSHWYHNLRSGGARSWTPSSTDSVPNIVPVEIPRAVRAGKMVGGQGIYVQTKLLATDGSGGVASFQGVPPGGDPTQISVSNGEVQLEIDIQAPTWAPYDQIQIFRNASTHVNKSNAGVPTLFTAVPTLVLHKGTDFTVTTLPVNGSSRFQTHLTQTFSGLSQDQWFVVVVRGTQGVSPPMFPVHPDSVSLTQNTNLAALENVTASENGIRALGFTNALYLDVDGNGVFDPPGVSVTP